MLQQKSNTHKHLLHILLHIDYLKRLLIPIEQIPRIHLISNIIQAAVIAVGNDCLALLLERIKIVDDFAAEECFAILESRFIDDDFGTLGLDAFHDALDGTLAEVVGV